MFKADAHTRTSFLGRATSRRSWLATSLLGASAMTASNFVERRGTTARGAEPIAGNRHRSIRVAQLADVHVQPERGGGDGMAMCLDHIQSQKDAPALILNTGDCVMDSFRKDDARTALQWDLWKRVMKAECSLPIESCLGNHDIWGWDTKKSKTTGREAGWGKQRGLDALGLAKPYHSFDRGGWHFVMLDSVVPFGDREYRAKIDDEQFDWLERDLAANAGKHTFVASHIPVFSTAGVLTTCSESDKTPGQLASNGGSLHLDARRLHELFVKSGNVRACISGHLHIIDRADFCGVTYLCNPAVSGNWWKGKNLGRFGEMYTLLDLFDDGTFDVNYASYGWAAKLEPGDKIVPVYPATAPAV